MAPRTLDDLTTPALVVDATTLERNLATMAAALPGARLRPHVKAHKCTELARRQREAGHPGFTCATIREVEGMVAAGLGDDLLLANEVVDATRLAALKGNVMLAVDSPETIAAAAAAGVRQVLVDINVGVPRCGIPPDGAGALADQARAAGLDVRGVMGYEGHAVGIEERATREELALAAMDLLFQAHDAVGGDIVSAGGTGTFDISTRATEIQAGSYALMDTAYAKLDIPFRPALHVLCRVISVNASGYAVANGGLKAFGMDHGNPEMVGGHTVWFLSDEHTTFSPAEPVRVGDFVRMVPAHIDPTVAYHERIHIVDGEEVLESWPVDLRGW